MPVMMVTIFYILNLNEAHSENIWQWISCKERRHIRRIHRSLVQRDYINSRDFLICMRNLSTLKPQARYLLYTQTSRCKYLTGFVSYKICIYWNAFIGFYCSSSTICVEFRVTWGRLRLIIFIQCPTKLATVTDCQIKVQYALFLSLAIWRVAELVYIGSLFVLFT